MIIYDYDNNAVEIELPDKPIAAINVSVVSGDETGSVVFKDGTVIPFDASDCRIMGFDDGFYCVCGEDIQAWLDFKPTDGRTASYMRQSLFS